MIAPLMPLLAIGLTASCGMVPAAPAGAEGPACGLEAGVDPDIAADLCQALREAGAGADLRLVVLATGPSLLAARLDGPAGPGPRMDLSISDRRLTEADHHRFARDLLRHGLPR